VVENSRDPLAHERVRQLPVGLRSTIATPHGRQNQLTAHRVYNMARTRRSARRNPAWHRDELILALDLYQRLGRRVADDRHPDVVSLSELLNKLPIQSQRPDATRFRNGNGVALKLANFHHRATGRGMSRGNRLEEGVWNEFSNDSVRLGAAVANIKRKYQNIESEKETASSAPEYASLASEIRGSLRTFNREATGSSKRATKLLQSTTYWVYDPDSDDFGPGKFAGLADMTLERYEHVRHAADGHVTHKTIERVLDDRFQEHEEWHQLLISWGERLLGAEVFGKADTSKWRFISLRSHSESDAIAESGRRGRRGTFDVGHGKVITYFVAESQRQLSPTHREYQSRLGSWLKARHITPEFERDFVDVRFEVAGKHFIGEVKPTERSSDTAFRTALGQVLFYAFVTCDSTPEMILFLDCEPDEKRIDLASRLGVAVVVETAKGQFRILNRRAAPLLATLFDSVMPGSLA
jgi:hypothetical protein